MPGIDEARIWDLVNEDWSKMLPAEKHFWELIKIMPEKWLSEPYKYRPLEAWVVAIAGSHVIWYNETWFGDEFNGMDSGFACSYYKAYGQIGGNFGGGEWELATAVAALMHRARPL